MKVKTFLGGALPLFAVGAALCTTGSASAQCASTLLYDNGFPNNCVVVGSQVGDTAGASPAGADDFTLTGDATINDIHWYTADQSANGIGWTGDVRVSIYPDDGNCNPDVANPVVSGDFGANQSEGVVARTIVAAESLSVGGVTFDLVRYDLEKISIGLSAGTYWLSVQPISDGTGAGDSLWLSSNCAVNGDAIVGCPAQSEADAGAGFTVVEVPAAGDTIDLNFQLSTCPGAPCPANLDNDDGLNVVNVFDLLVLLGAWGSDGPGSDLDDPTNVVDVFDLLALLGAWGDCPAGGGTNDDCEFATLIIGSGDVAFDLAGATPDGPDDGANCDPPIPGGTPDIWYCYKSECEGFTTITLDVAAGLSVYAIAADSCNADPLPAPVACSNDGSVRFFAEAGFHYKIRISGSTDTSGNMNIADCEPFNDECVDAIQLFTGDEFEGTLLGFSPDPVAPNCPALQGAAVGTTPGVWFVTVGDGTTYTARTCQDPAPGGGGFSDPPGQADRIAVYCGTSCDGLISPCIITSDPNCTLSPPGTQANVSWCTVPGVIYFLNLSMDNNTDTPGPYRLTLESNGIDCTPQSFEASCPGIPGSVCAIDPPDGSGDGCQLPDTGTGQGADGIVGATSDRNPGAGFTVADNMVPASSGQITEVCWWGLYFNFTAGADCAPGDGSGSSDDFRIRFFGDDGNGFPDDNNILATYNIGSLQLNTEKIFTGLTTAGLQEWEFTAQLSPALNVTGGQCIWMEISNNTQADCFWLWETAPPGNGNGAQDTDGDYAAGDSNDFDHAWCVDIALADPNGCSTPPEIQPVICTLSGYFQDWPNFGTGITADADMGGSLGSSFAVADQFIVDGAGNITGVCWWGIFLQFSGGFSACGAVPPETSPFSVTYYGDSGSEPPLPDTSNVLGGPFVMAPDDREDTTLDFGTLADVYEFTMSHSPVAVADGETVWVEISHTGNEACVFLWTNSPGAADGLAGQSTDGVYSSIAFDLSFRVNVDGIAPAPPGPPANDNCADAETISDGDTDYSTIGATTDGPENPAGECNDFGATQTANDIWYVYTASCTGTLLVTTCEDLGGSANYDTDLVVYDTTDCGNLAANLLGCNDDDPNNPCGGTPDFHSTVEVPVVSGNQYLIRVGGWDEGDVGTGTLHIECTP